MFNAIKCAYWTRTALSHYQNIEIFTNITRHNGIYAGSVKRHYTVCVFYWLCSCSYYCKIVQLCCLCSEESETASSCSGDVKNCCGFLSRSSHDTALNTISHRTQISSWRLFQSVTCTVFVIGIAAPNIGSNGWENVRGFTTVSVKTCATRTLFKTKTSVVCCKPCKHEAQFRKK